ncbi:hypothetical protein ACIQOW_20635 [Kitasatospora sp. NPDC091335]|uniref:hypothetical protein n=1 Tax=unclassified Kitasatospora TaxID=2633591 RepID=UPI0037C146EB
MPQALAEMVGELDLSIDQEVFSAPGGGDLGASMAVEGDWTTSTTCWSCKWTCDCPPGSTCTC